ncbi:MAG: hypothetical protein ACO2Z9_03440 [Crocinitomicaceae bacterium]
MESFIRRLKYYGIGFGIGIVFVFFFFRNRGCSWLPENRVKNAILDRLVVVSDSTSDVLKANGLDHDYLVQVLNDGDVLFDESDKEGDSKTYILEKDGKRFYFTLPHESFISEAGMAQDVKNIKPTSSGYGRILRYPLDSNLVFVDSSRLLTCLQADLGLINPRRILKGLKENGKIDFEKTDLEVRPKAEHYLVFDLDTVQVGLKAIWYKNKINVHYMDVPRSDCYTKFN